MDFSKTHDFKTAATGLDVAPIDGARPGRPRNSRRDAGATVAVVNALLLLTK